MQELDDAFKHPSGSPKYPIITGFIAFMAFLGANIIIIYCVMQDPVYAAGRKGPVTACDLPALLKCRFDAT